MFPWKPSGLSLGGCSSGWWYTYPSEKYESQIGSSSPIWLGKIKKHVPNHQPVEDVHECPYIFPGFFHGFPRFPEDLRIFFQVVTPAVGFSPDISVISAPQTRAAPGAKDGSISLYAYIVHTYNIIYIYIYVYIIYIYIYMYTYIYIYYYIYYYIILYILYYILYIIHYTLYIIYYILYIIYYIYYVLYIIIYIYISCSR